MHIHRVNVVVLLSSLVLVGCSDDEPLDQCYEPTVELAVCDPSGSFSLGNGHAYFPLVVGNATVLEGEEDGEQLRLEITVTDQTEEVAGVTTRVVEARELIDGELYEIAYDFYAVAADGTVCYFGEDVEFYENGQLANTNGSWRAGVDGAMPGIIMPASAAAGQRFFQENAPGIALDMSRVDAIDLDVTVGGQPRQAVTRMMDSNPLDGQQGCDEEEEKLFAPGIGLIKDSVIELVSFTPGT